MASTGAVIAHFICPNGRPAALLTLLSRYAFRFLRGDQSFRFPEPSLASWEPSLES